MITLTDFAAEKVKELIADEGEADLALRVAVRPGGCSGYSYEMFFDSETEAECRPECEQRLGHSRAVWQQHNRVRAFPPTCRSSTLS